jgi:hypothetical protein
LFAITILAIVAVALLLLWNFRKSALENHDTALPTSEEYGDLISTIAINLKATSDQLEDFPDGTLPWINIEKTRSAIQQLIDPDEVVLTEAGVTLVIDYPLNKEAKFALSSTAGGFTRKQLVLSISQKYHEIYTVEENTATVKTIPRDKRVGLINRNQTDGEYGIWGHDLGDLDLSEIEVYKTKDGKILLKLDVQS